MNINCTKAITEEYILSISSSPVIAQVANDFKTLRKCYQWLVTNFKKNIFTLSKGITPLFQEEQETQSYTRNKRYKSAPIQKNREESEILFEWWWGYFKFAMRLLLYPQNINECVVGVMAKGSELEIG